MEAIITERLNISTLINKFNSANIHSFETHAKIINKCKI